MIVASRLIPLCLLLGFLAVGPWGPGSSAPGFAADDNQNASAPSPPQQAVDLAKARALVKAKDWVGAIAELVAATEKAIDADAYNLLAFSLRNQGHNDAAFIYYFKALTLNPDHRGAREYLGELYAKLGQLDKAREQLAILERLCPSGCEEREDLEAAIASATAK